MLSLRDPYVRLALLSHLARYAAEGPGEALEAAGIRARQAAQLRELKAMDLIALADHPGFPIALNCDLAKLDTALRFVSRLNQARSLELYFIKNGASSRMMRRLFKLSKRATHRRRLEHGCWCASGRLRLPEGDMRERIIRAWFYEEHQDIRVRYYLLHRSFPEFSMAVLEAVVRADEYES